MSKIVSILASLAHLAIGFYLLFHPLTSLIVLGYLFAIGMLLSGASDIVSYVKKTNPNRSFLELLTGVIWIVAGLSLLTSSALGLSTLIPSLIGYSFLFNGLVRLVLGFKMRQLLPKIGKHLMVFGVVSMIFGLFILNHTLFSAILLGYFLALAVLSRAFEQFWFSLKH